MGCYSSAICTDILLLVSEFILFAKLKEKGLLNNIKRYFRFRDDINLRIFGNHILSWIIIKMIITAYPSSIDLNVKISFLSNTFLNLRTYIIPGNKNLSISVLRKQHDRHDIVRYNSHTHPNYIGAAIALYKPNLQSPAWDSGGKSLV